MSSLRSLQAWLQRLSNGVNRLAIVFCVGCVLAMLGISFTGFLYTLFTGGALSWTYSLARLFLPWIGLISSTIALHSGEHVAMTLLVKLLPRPLVVLAAGATLAVIGALALVGRAERHALLAAPVVVPPHPTVPMPVPSAATSLRRRPPRVGGSPPSIHERVRCGVPLRHGPGLELAPLVLGRCGGCGSSCCSRSLRARGG